MTSSWRRTLRLGPCFVPLGGTAASFAIGCQGSLRILVDASCSSPEEANNQVQLHGGPRNLRYRTARSLVPWPPASNQGTGQPERRSVQMIRTCPQYEENFGSGRAKSLDSSTTLTIFDRSCDLSRANPRVGRCAGGCGFCLCSAVMMHSPVWNSSILLAISEPIAAPGRHLLVFLDLL